MTKRIVFGATALLAALTLAGCYDDHPGRVGDYGGHHRGHHRGDGNGDGDGSGHHRGGYSGGGYGGGN